MGHQLYSGNLEAFKCACKRLEDAGVEVRVSREYYDPIYMEYREDIELYEPRGSSEALHDRRIFWHRDIDVLYINMTEWLNRQAAAYESWK